MCGRSLRVNSSDFLAGPYHKTTNHTSGGQARLQQQPCFGTTMFGDCIVRKMSIVVNVRKKRSWTPFSGAVPEICPLEASDPVLASRLYRHISSPRLWRRGDPGGPTISDMSADAAGQSKGLGLKQPDELDEQQTRTEFKLSSYQLDKLPARRLSRRDSRRYGSYWRVKFYTLSVLARFECQRVVVVCIYACTHTRLQRRC